MSNTAEYFPMDRWYIVDTRELNKHDEALREQSCGAFFMR